MYGHAAWNYTAEVDYDWKLHDDSEQSKTVIKLADELHGGREQP